MDTEIKSAVRATDQDAQYDEKAKNLLGHKYILAYILIKMVDEFKGMRAKEIVPYIEGEPKIGVVPVGDGMTNVKEEKNGEKLVGFNSENSENNEGLVRFDIVFYVRMKDGLSQIIINVEAQKDEPMVDNYHWKGKRDLINIVMIGLSDELPQHDEKYELHRLLGALLSQRLSVDEKLSILGTEYDIPLEESLRKDVSVMCNLSQGIKEYGIEIGEAKIIMSMYKKGYTVEQIADVSEKSIEEVREIIENKELTLV